MKIINILIGNFSQKYFFIYKSQRLVNILQFKERIVNVGFVKKIKRNVWFSHQENLLL